MTADRGRIAARLAGALATVLLGAALLAGSGLAHTYFAALTRINHNARAGTLEVIHALTAHDVEAFASQAAGDRLSVYSTTDLARIEPILRDYLASAFALAGEAGPLDLAWVGMEQDGDTIYAYLEGPMPSAPARLTVTNTIFTDVYPGQRNRVLITAGTRRETLLFDAASGTATAELGDR